MELALSSARAVMSPALPVPFRSTSSSAVARLLAAAQVEHGRRQLVDLVLDALDEVGHTVNDGLHEPHHDGGSGGAEGIALVDPLHVEREGLGLGVAHGHQAVAGEDEGDRRRLRDRLVDVVGDRCGHEISAALRIEAVRGLDLPHFGARRDIDAECFLDEAVLLLRGLQKVEPHAVPRDGSRGVVHLQALAVGFIDRQHRVS